MSKKAIDSFLVFLNISLGLYFILRILDLSKIINNFVVHVTGDIPSYMAQVHFLSNYSFHQLVPHWFNGFILFLRYPPGWHYYTLPLYKLLGSLTLATYVSIITIFILIFLAIYYFGKSQELSKTKIISLFLIVFANAISIGNFLRLGRAPELFGWLWFIVITAMLIWYKDHEIDLKFLWIIPAYFLLILSHPPLNIFFHSLLLFPTLFLIKKPAERWIILAAVLIAIVASAFWWLPFVADNFEQQTALSDLTHGKRMQGLEDQPLFNFVLNNLATTTVSLLLLFSFYIYWKYKTNKSKKELLFYSPILLLSALFASRATLSIPLLSIVYPDIYATGFLFFSFFFIFKTPLNKKQEKLVILLLALFIISNVAVSALYTPWFPTHTEVEEKLFDLYPSINGKFIMSNSPYPSSHPHAHYAYASVYYDVYSSYGMGSEGLFPAYKKPIGELNKAIIEKNCENLMEQMEILKATNIISFHDDCKTLNECKLKLIKSNDISCLYEK